MSILKPEYYVCYHCHSESLKITVYSYSIQTPLIYRTDGKCINHPVYSEHSFVMWCPHCEKFVLEHYLKKGKGIINNKEFEEIGFKSYKVFRNMELRYFPGSKKSNEELEAIKTEWDKVKMNPFKWFRGLYSCEEILFALNSHELRDDEETRYKLRLLFWRINNESKFSFDSDPNATPTIYEKLLKAWENKTDERYLFKAEMLRNMGKFKESNELLKKPLPEYVSVLNKHKKWAKVIKILNSLKYKKSIEINIHHK